MNHPQLSQHVDRQFSSGRQQTHLFRRTRPTFTVACWALGLVGFVELITVGAALAVRVPASKEDVLPIPLPAKVVASKEEKPIEPRTVEQILADVDKKMGGYSAQPSLEEKNSEYGPVRVQPSLEDSAINQPPPLPELQAHAHANTQMSTVIANPRVERLVQEARKFHLEGDVMRAMLKLDEAGRIDPNECAVIYQKGLLFEDMGSYTRAADQYQQIQQMGLVKAGPYYSLAASKLTKGMDTASVRRETIAIGPMKLNRGTGKNAGRHVEVAITLLARPDRVVQPQDVEVQVFFYDKVNGGEIKKAAANALISPRWADSKVDWQDAGNEETLRVSYTIPEENLADEYLLGRREFYGYVVELLYKGEVVDQQAYPRRLNSIHGHGGELGYPEGLDEPWLPGDDGGLLPDKNAEFDSELPLPDR